MRHSQTWNDPGHARGRRDARAALAGLARRAIDRGEPVEAVLPVRGADVEGLVPDALAVAFHGGIEFVFEPGRNAVPVIGYLGRIANIGTICLPIISDIGIAFE